MEFPNEAKYLIDWSPSCGVSYIEYLENKSFASTIEFAIPEAVLPRLASIEQLGKRGFAAGDLIANGLIRLTRDIAFIRNAVQIGANDVSSVLRWHLADLAIGLPRMGQIPQPKDGALPLPAQPYEEFAHAKIEYVHGRYDHALACIARAIDGDERSIGFKPEFRFHFMLGRIRIGAWGGEIANASRDVVNPTIAETAFLDAERLLKQDTSATETEAENARFAERALMLLWAGRAAYYCGRHARATTHTREATALISPTREGLYAAAQYQLAKFLSPHNDERKEAEDALKLALERDPTLAVEAAADPDFVGKDGVLDAVLDSSIKAAKTRFVKTADEFAAGLEKAGKFAYVGVSAAQLLKEELTTLAQFHAEAAHTAETGGILDFDAAAKAVDNVKPQIADLFPTFRTRFTYDRLHKWENLLVTRAARATALYVKQCSKEFDAADDIYRKNGGYDRSGGGEKVLYGVVCLVLALYMVYAHIRLQGQTLAAAGLFFVGACWLFVLYVRRKLGLVEGVEKQRATKAALATAKAEAETKETIAAKTWLFYQRTIDALNRMRPPF